MILDNMLRVWVLFWVPGKDQEHNRSVCVFGG